MVKYSLVNSTKLLFQVNPGNVNLFPWLSTISTCYERYRFHKLRYEYVPWIGTSATGAIQCSFDYDASDVDVDVFEP